MSGTTMASLVDANYTDSEEENEPLSPPNLIRSKKEEDNTDPEQKHNRTPNSVGSKHSNEGSARSTPSKALRLVSYDLPEDNEDHANQLNTSAENIATVAADSDKNVEPVEMDLDTEDDANSQPGEATGIAVDTEETENEQRGKSQERQKKLSISASVDAWTDGVKLPPEPPGLCSPALQESINKLYQRKIERGYDFNAVIQSKKSFRNPSIYEKLIQFCAIDEHGTNFPKELYDGHLFGPESYYDELAKVQKVDMERREKAAKERSAKSAIKADKRPEESSGGGPSKRRSKWDQVGPAGASVSAFPSQSASGSVLSVSSQSGRPTLVAPTTASTAGKTIPAFGNLKKH